ncbi:rhomboid family intramembrane serine protease [Streptomyces sp. bgisy100]|uniref:rhomboid family intramembrane serine protease n=1 Tax=Streptomyces sp. bgisy100 TaxID=3413783 RepID=UPI003D70D4E4
MIPTAHSVKQAAAGALRAARNGPLVTYALIGSCCLIFALGPASGLVPADGSEGDALAAQVAHFERWGVIPSELLSGEPRALLTPLTALFVHGNWLHLLGNMLFLFVFGGMAEERMGRAAYAFFYLAVGCLALAGYAAVHADSSQTLVGASGAISGVLGAFLYLFPGARVTSLFPFLFFLPLRFPAWMVLVFWFGLQWLAAGKADSNQPGVAYLAHLIGFCLGFLYAWARYRRSRPWQEAPAAEGGTSAAEGGAPAVEGGAPAAEGGAGQEG